MIYLSDAEVAEICRPLKQPAAQIRFLQQLGFRVHRRPDGTPLVLVGPEQAGAHNPKPQDGPKWTK